MLEMHSGRARPCVLWSAAFAIARFLFLPLPELLRRPIQSMSSKLTPNAAAAIGNNDAKKPPMFASDIKGLDESLKAVVFQMALILRFHASAATALCISSFWTELSCYGIETCKPSASKGTLLMRPHKNSESRQGGLTSIAIHLNSISRVFTLFLSLDSGAHAHSDLTVDGPGYLRTRPAQDQRRAVIEHFFPFQNSSFCVDPCRFKCCPSSSFRATAGSLTIGPWRPYHYNSRVYESGGLAFTNENEFQQPDIEHVKRGLLRRAS